MFCETSPGPVKFAAAQMGLCGGSLRPPLGDIAESSMEQVMAALHHTGLIDQGRN